MYIANGRVPAKAKFGKGPNGLVAEEDGAESKWERVGGDKWSDGPITIENDLFIHGLPNSVSEEALRQVFGAFGEIVKVSLPNAKNICFIHYPTHDSVRKALESRPFAWDGAPLNVDRRKQFPKTSKRPIHSGPPTGGAVATAPAAEKDSNGFERVGGRGRPSRGGRGGSAVSKRGGLTSAAAPVDAAGTNGDPSKKPAKKTKAPTAIPPPAPAKQ